MEAFSPQQTTDIATIHVGQAHIQQDCAVIVLFGTRDCDCVGVGAGSGFLDVEFFMKSELLRQCLAKFPVVFDNQYVSVAAGCHSRILHRMTKRLCVIGPDGKSRGFNFWRCDAMRNIVRRKEI